MLARRTTIVGIGVLVSALAGVLVATAFAGQSPAPARGPNSAISLVAAGGEAVAVEQASGAAGVPAFDAAKALPAGLALWVAAAEFGPEGPGQPSVANRVVLDYYDGNVPRTPQEVVEYRGLRVQVVFYGVQVTPDSSFQEVAPAPAGGATVLRKQSELPGTATDVYFVQRAGASVEVRVWDTAGKAIPGFAEMAASLGALTAAAQ